MMNLMVRGLILGMLVVLVGCAHPITITPNLAKIDRKDARQIDKNVGYFISAEDRFKEVTTPGGGGDSIKYTPYNDLEPALQKVLGNIFKTVHRMPAVNDAGFIAQNDISFVFVPRIETNSSSSGIMTWMATDFTVKLDCKAFNRNGDVVWEKTLEDSGHADFNELMQDFQASSRRASEKVFSKLQQEISSDPVFSQ